MQRAKFQVKYIGDVTIRIEMSFLQGNNGMLHAALQTALPSL